MACAFFLDATARMVTLGLSLLLDLFPHRRPFFLIAFTFFREALPPAIIMVCGAAFEV